MPRNGSGVYEIPDGTHGVEATTIESAKYNTYVDDVSLDLNLPRPIVAGGTGANNAVDAMENLHGEISKQIITNFDSDPMYSGSFWAAATVTAGPVINHAFAGIIYKTDDNNMVVQARDASDTTVPGRMYVREKKAGVWGPWKNDGRDIIGDAEGFGSEAGDMFFGIRGVAPNSKFIVNDKKDASGVDLFNVTKAGVIIHLDDSPIVQQNKTGGATASNNIQGARDDKMRWNLSLGDNTAETGTGNAGSNLTIARYADDGTVLNAPMTINRASGATSFIGNVTITGDLFSSRSANEGVIWLGTNSQHYLHWSGTAYVMPSGKLTLGADGVSGTDAATINQLNTKQAALGFTPVRQGGGPSQTADQINIGWSGGGLRASVNNSDLGPFIFASSAPILNGRLVFAADTSVNAFGITEPYGGAVMTGFGWQSSATFGRFRYLQLYTTGWFTVGYA